MNKNVVIGAIVIIALGLGIWYFSSGSGTTTQDTATTTSDTGGTGAGTPAATQGKAGTFRSIFTQTGNHQCSYEQVSATGRASSVVYIADGKMRGEFRTASGNTNTASLMIYDGGYLYSWKEGATVGKKTTIRTIADLPEAIPNDLTSGAVFGTASESVGWDCHDWAKDVKVFTIPTYVKFSAGS